MSEERREALIEALIEDQPELGDLIRRRPNDFMAGSWDLLAYSFQRGFEVMWDHACRDQSGLLDRPMLTLWRQSVELALKAAVVEIAGGLGQKPGHDLAGLFEQLLKARAALGHTDDDDHAKHVRATINHVQSLDPFADRFRYPTSKRGAPFGGLSVDFDTLFQAHWLITTWCEGAALEVEESRRLD